jgi:3-hydroxyacyl-[acyl-carrier-protein] dehydratase
MAQCSILLMKDELEGKLPLYAGLDKIRFKRVVKPGDKVVVNASLKVKRSTVIVVDAVATVEGQLACKGDLSFYLVPKE